MILQQRWLFNSFVSAFRHSFLVAPSWHGICWNQLEVISIVHSCSHSQTWCPWVPEVAGNVRHRISIQCSFLERWSQRFFMSPSELTFSSPHSPAVRFSIWLSSFHFLNPLWNKDSCSPTLKLAGFHFHFRGEIPLNLKSQSLSISSRHASQSQAAICFNP
jgi:hypothetical protein